jgi:hypothetical protein
MIELKDFFVASVGAAGALIGLLFVAVSLGRDRIFGPAGDREQRGKATAAFIALGNVFFLSLAALVPNVGPKIILVLALVALVQIIKASGTMARLYPEFRGWRRFGLISAAIYLLEFAIALRFVLKQGPDQGLVYTVLGLYAYALGVSWNLLASYDPNGPATG